MFSHCLLYKTLIILAKNSITFFSNLLLITESDQGSLSQLELVYTEKYPVFKLLVEDLRLRHELAQSLRSKIYLELSRS